MPTKLLWHSNSPLVPTGYGQQTALFAPKVNEHFDLAISVFYGIEGAPIKWQGIPVLPGIGQDFGNAFLLQHAKHWFGDVKDGIVFTLQDVWPLSAQMASRINMACWTPIDHEPPIPGVLNFFNNSGAIPVAMSRFGEEQLRNAGLDPLYVPHGVDTEVYCPQPDRLEIREQVGIPKDAFLVGMVAANKGTPSRKGFNQAFQAFRIFREKHSEAKLYLHTQPDSGYAAGEDLEALGQALGIWDAVVLPPRYNIMFDPFAPSLMAKLYSAMDVFLNPSWGEGFGVPIIEAQACGVPAIVTNATAMPEVCGVGWKVGCRPHWTAGKSFMFIPDVEGIVDALEQSYDLSDEARKNLSADARTHALTYDVDKVMEDHFLPALAEIERRIKPRPVVELVTPNGRPASKVAIEK